MDYPNKPSTDVVSEELINNIREHVQTQLKDSNYEEAISVGSKSPPTLWLTKNLLKLFFNNNKQLGFTNGRQTGRRMRSDWLIVNGLSEDLTINLILTSVMVTYFNRYFAAKATVRSMSNLASSDEYNYITDNVMYYRAVHTTKQMNHVLKHSQFMRKLLKMYIKVLKTKKVGKGILGINPVLSELSEEYKNINSIHLDTLFFNEYTNLSKKFDKQRGAELRDSTMVSLYSDPLYVTESASDQIEEYQDDK